MLRQKHLKNLKNYNDVKKKFKLSPISKKNFKFSIKFNANISSETINFIHKKSAAGSSLS